MVSIEDASAAYSMAEKAFNGSEWANCVLNAQRCIELSLKSLLDELGIGYEIKGGKGHINYLYPIERLSENMERICEKLNLKNYEKVRIARSFVCALLWQSVRNIAQGFGPKGVAVKDLFQKEEADLAKSHAWSTYNLCRGHIERWRRESSSRGVQKPREHLNEIEKAVVQAYEEVLHRPPDADGLKTYSECLRKGMTIEWLKKVLRESPEYKQKFGSS